MRGRATGNKQQEPRPSGKPALAATQEATQAPAPAASLASGQSATEASNAPARPAPLEQRQESTSQLANALTPTPDIYNPANFGKWTCNGPKEILTENKGGLVFQSHIKDCKYTGSEPEQPGPAASELPEPPLPSGGKRRSKKKINKKSKKNKKNKKNKKIEKLKKTKRKGFKNKDYKWRS
jgi:hypothetical protein